MKYKVSFKSLLIICGLISSTLSAKFYAPSTLKEFNDILARADLAVIHFNPYGLGDVPVSDEDTLEEMKQDFIELAQEKRYLMANVAFIGVNTARIPVLAKEYNINPEAKATLVLFKDGNEYKEAKRKVGYLTKGQMRAFVEKYFGDIIDKLIVRRPQPQQRVVTRYSAPTSYSYPINYYDNDYYPRVVTRYNAPISYSYPVDYYDYDYYNPRERYAYPSYGYGYPGWGGWGPGIGFGIGGDGFGFGIGLGF